MSMMTSLSDLVGRARTMRNRRATLMRKQRSLTVMMEKLEGRELLAANPTTSVVSLTTGTNPAALGTALTFSDVVSVGSANNGNPAGSVQFKDNGNNLGSPVSTSSATSNKTTTYQLSVSNLSAGAHTITAVYTSSDTTQWGNSTSAGLSETINMGTVTVTANPQTKVYGASVPTLTYSYSGLQNGDSFTGSLATTGTASSNVGTYAITQGTLSAGPNYTINYTGANLAVTTAPLTVTADAKSKVYGATVPSLTYGYSGLVNGDTSGVFSGSLVTTGTASSNVGSYPISQGTLSAGSNYAISYTGANLTVTTAPLTVTADAKSKVYGATVPSLTYGYSGLVNGDTSGVFSGSLATTGTASSNVGSYPISQGTLSAGSNYAISYAGANLTVTTAPLTVTADAKSKVYGAALPSLTYGYSGLVNGDTSGVFSGSLATTGTVSSNVGSYPISQGTLSAGPNYAISYTGANLTVTTAPLTVTADAKSKVYGAALPSLTYGYSGLVNGDTSGVFSGSLATTGTVSSNVGSYPISQGTLSAGSNYAISYTGANLTVTTAPLTVTADAKSKVYGDAVPSLTYGYSGLVNGDTSAVFTGSQATTATASSNVGTYPISQGTLSAGSNYTISYTGANLTVTTAPLTVTADAKSKVYGDAVPSLTYGFSGLVNGDTSGVFSGGLATTGTASSNVGNYPITQGTLSAGSNYTISYTGANLTVTTAPLTVTADPQSKVYGAPLPNLTFGYSGLVNGDTSAVFTGSQATTATASSNVGTYPISQGTLTAGSNYTISYNGVNLTVTTAQLTVTADTQSKVYGDAIPSLTFGYSGLVNGDTSGIFTGSLATTGSATSNVGIYPISQGTLSAGANYAISYTGANLTVTTAPLTITADPLSKIYGDALPSLTYGYSGLVNGDTSTVFTGSLATTATASSNVGTYPISQGTLTAGSNYSISYTGANLTVTTASLTVTGNPQSKVYGASLPSLTYSYSGLVNGDTSAVFTGGLATTATASSNVGSYPISQGTLSAGSNYTISYTGANLTVTTAPLTVTADPQSKVYGAALPSLTYGYSGLVNGDTSAVFTGSLVTTATASSNVGSYPISQGTLSAGSNYTISYTGANLTVTTAPLTVTADAKSKVYGDAVPSLTFGYSGLVNGDTSAVFTGSQATTATASSNVGTYPITQGTLTAGSNYTISFTGANLTVTTTPLTVTGDPQSKVYGASLPSLTYGYSGLVNGDTSAVFTGSLATTATASSNVGTYPISQGTLTAGSNYTISYTGANLTVTTAPLTVTADPQSKVYGASLPNLTFGYSGLVNGDTSAVFTGSQATTATASSNVGSYPISQGNLSAGSNYTISYTGANLTVTTVPLTVTADPQSKVYGASLPSLTYGYSGLVNGDTSAVFTGSLATTATASSNVGTYPISQGTLSAGSNYTISYTGANLTVTTAPLTVTADAKSKVYGAAVPGLIYGYSGLVNGDSSTVFTGGLATTATSSSGVGSYPISQGTLAAGSNYAVNYTGASVTVTPATLTVTVDNQNMGHGDSVPTLTYSLSGFVLGENATTAGVTGSASPSTTATSTSSAGYYPIWATAGTLAAPNYTFATVGGSMAVHPKILAVNVRWGVDSLNIIGANRDLPFFNITAVDVLFSDDVTGVSGTSGISLTSTNGGPVYTFNSGSYSGNDAVRGLPTAIGIDKLSLAVSNGVAANGFPGLTLFGATNFAFSVLPGDFNGDGSVNIADSAGINKLIGGETTQPFNVWVWADMDGDGHVTSTDYTLSKSKTGTKL